MNKATRMRRLEALIIAVTFCMTMLACNLARTSTTGSETAIPNPVTDVYAMPLVYYAFASIPGDTFPAGSVVIVPGEIILSPEVSSTPRQADIRENIRGALGAMIADPRNLWQSENVTIDSVEVDSGIVTIRLSGAITGVGGAVLGAAQMQILMTVFAEPAVTGAIVTLNGESIANLGISHSSEARTPDHAYSRDEITAFMTSNLYAP